MLLPTINALTLCTRDMARSCAFYSDVGLTQTFGGPKADFTTFSAFKPVTRDNNAMHVNLVYSPGYVHPEALPGVKGGWGRVVIFVDDVDALHARLADRGVSAPEPRDAPWGERYFHVLDPSGHELSFATPLYDHPRWSQAGSLDALDESVNALRSEQKAAEADS